MGQNRQTNEKDQRVETKREKLQTPFPAATAASRADDTDINVTSPEGSWDYRGKRCHYRWRQGASWRVIVGCWGREPWEISIHWLLASLTGSRQGQRSGLTQVRRHKQDDGGSLLCNGYMIRRIHAHNDFTIVHKALHWALYHMWFQNTTELHTMIIIMTNTQM